MTYFCKMFAVSFKYVAINVIENFIRLPNKSKPNQCKSNRQRQQTINAGQFETKEIATIR